MLKQRIITASILFVLFLVALFGLPTWGWQLLVLLVVGQGAVEWARLSGFAGRKATAYWMLLLVLMLIIIGLDYQWGTDSEPQALLRLICYMLAVVFWVFVVPAWLMAGWQPKSAAFMGWVGVILLIPTGLAMLDLHAFNPWLLLFVMTIVMAADIAAYFAGKRYGESKLAPSISPNKTWEGVFGALIGVSIYIALVGYISDLHKYYSIFPAAIIAGWWWVALSIVGDLFESAIKRQAGVKDSGALLPGHGGLLDRIDALTSTLPFAGIWLILQRLG